MRCHYCGEKTPTYHCIYLNHTILNFCDDHCFLAWGGDPNTPRFTEIASVDLSRDWP